MACGDDECPLEVVKYLVEECKVDVAVADNDGQLPLPCATRYDSEASYALVKYLVNACGCFDQVHVGNKKGRNADAPCLSA